MVLIFVKSNSISRGFAKKPSAPNFSAAFTIEELSALNKKDWDGIMRMAHRMIPSYNYLEINTLIPDLKLLKELADEKKEFDQVASLIKNISTVTHQVMEQLETEAEKIKQSSYSKLSVDKQLGKINAKERIHH